MEMFSLTLHKLQVWVWGLPLLLFLGGAGLYLTFLLRGIQFRFLGYAMKLAFGRHEHKNAKGDVSHFQALMMSLAAMIGIGCIAGVATAISIGGLGALFWMWVATIFGMVIKYGEAILAIKYRTFDKKGGACGGPMYYLDKGLGWKWLGTFYATAGCLACFASGNMPQSNAVAEAMHNLFGLDHWWTGGILAIITAMVLIGGVKGIGRVCSYLVPVMALFYLGGGALVLAMHIEKVPGAVWDIVASAFTGQAAIGGFVGSSVMMAVRFGIARGVFANEAGLGTSSIAAAAAKTDLPARQALISMTGAFLTTVVCTFTGLIIAVTGVLGEVGPSGKLLNGVSMVMHAFNSTVPGGGVIVTIGAFFFGYSTILGWAYYGEKCCEYLFGFRSTRIYRFLYIIFVVLGAKLSLELVWGMADIMNGLMTVANVMGVLGLSGVIVAETKVFLCIVDKERQLALPKVSETAEG